MRPTLRESAKPIMKSKSANKKTRAASAKKDPNRYPKGWNRRKVQAIIDHYDHQTDDEAISEAEAPYHSNRVTMIGVPVDLVPKIQKLIARGVIC
jgi:hypothetical protein